MEEEIRQYCLSMPGSTESFPFDNEALVFKVEGKMFALLNLGSRKFLNLKCLPEKSVELREDYSFISPGYHMNKKHWNTLDFSQHIPWSLVTELIEHSYSLVKPKLKKEKKPA
jgi:predicted DNA-binding protein (MmcQ/YjbR family)